MNGILICKSVYIFLNILQNKLHVLKNSKFSFIKRFYFKSKGPSLEADRSETNSQNCKEKNSDKSDVQIIMCYM